MQLVQTVSQRQTSAGKVRILSAKFEVPKSRMSRSASWDMCRLQGERNGIPQHAWTKCHGDGMWKWYTCTFREFKVRSFMHSKRKQGGE